MKSLHWIIRLILGVFFFLFIANGLPAQDRLETETIYLPQQYQVGKDVVWVPTEQTVVDKMLDMAKITSEDYVIDLGSGDGRIVISAAKRGARAHGIEYNPKMVELSRQNALKEGVSDTATFEQADLFETDFSNATVITMFLLPDINLELRPKILDMKPGTRIVSNSFDMKDWEADRFAEVEECESYCTAYFWIVPAKVGGTWKMPQGELILEQTFQNFTGTLRSGDKSIPLRGKLTGDKFNFAADGLLYSGTVSGDSMTGEIRGRKNSTWTATRVLP